MVCRPPLRTRNHNGFSYSLSLDLTQSLRQMNATVRHSKSWRNARGWHGKQRPLLIDCASLTSYFLQANPASPPAYLARPWLTQRLPSGPPDQTPPSPIAHTPSPLARRRRRIAGAILHRTAPLQVSFCQSIYNSLSFKLFLPMSVISPAAIL